MLKLTQEIRTFWAILEEELVEIPAYVKNILTYYGYGNPLSLKRLTDEKIIKLRGQVQNEFSAKFQEIGDERHTEWFFGRTENLKQFDFNDGDRDLIDVIINHIQSVGDNDKSIAVHYKDVKNAKLKKKSQSSEVFETAFGQVYGYNWEDGQNTLQDEDTNDLRNILFNKANIMFEKYETEEFQKKREFNMEMVQTSNINTDKGTAIGIVWCCFCEQNTPKSDVHVYCKSIDSGSWTLSNITTHMNRQHNVEIPRSKEVPSPKKQKTGSKDVSTDEENLKQIIVRQISEQMKKIGDSVKLNESSSSDGIAFKVLTTPRESHCVFTSLCHQLFYKLTTEMAQKLRNDAVEHIKQNFEKYAPILQKRVDQIKQVKKKSKLTSRTFLENHLNKSKTFAGAETFLAVKELYNVNIITLDEEGSLVAPACFNRTFDRTLLICSVDELYHKSVAYVSPDMIETISDGILALFLKRHEELQE